MNDAKASLLETTSADPRQGSRISVWLVEDDRTFRETMAAALGVVPDLWCARTFSSAEALIEALAASAEDVLPDVLLQDIHLPGQTGVEALPTVKSIAPETAVVMLTIAEDEGLIFEAFQAGASGYLIKEAPVEVVLEAVRQAARGGTLMPPPVARRVLGFLQDQVAPASSGTARYTLSEREREVLQLMSEGLTQRQIAEHLFVSPHTVNSHVQNCYVKLHVHSGVEAVAKAVRERLI